MDDLVTWLTQVWDEQEKLARRVADRYVTPDGAPYWPVASVAARFNQFTDDDVRAGLDLIKLHDPASVLARIAADRQILALHERVVRFQWAGTVAYGCAACKDNSPAQDDHAWPCETLLALVQPYTDRTGFREEWVS